MVFQLSERNLLLGLVDTIHGPEQRHRVSEPVGRCDQRPYVLRETRPSVTAAGIEKFRPDAGIGADPPTHIVDVGTNPFAEIGHLVHERNTCRQHSVGGILDHFGRGNIREKHPVAGHHEGLVKKFHRSFGTSAFRTHDDTVWCHEIGHGTSFFQEFGV